METSSPQSHTAPGHGRRPRNQVERIAAKLWANVVKMRAGVTTGYALDKLFWPEKFGRSYPKKGVNWSVAPCRFTVYLRGDSTPSVELQDLVEARFPGTKIWLHLPLYQMMRDPPLPLDELNALLVNTHPIIAERLFYQPQFGSRAKLQRKPMVEDAIKAFDREGDTVALTTCLGIIRQAEYSGEGLEHYRANKAAYRIYLRHAFHFPWCCTAREMFVYLAEHFFSFEYNAKGYDLNWSVNSDLSTFDKQLTLRCYLTLLIEDIGLLGFDVEEHRACIYAAEQIGILDIYSALKDLYHQWDWEAAKRHPMAKKLVAKIKKNGVTPDDLLRVSFRGYIHPAQLIPALVIPGSKQKD